MTRTLKLTIGAVVLMAVAGTAAAQDKMKLRIGTEGAYEPFNYFDSNNELKGFDVDIAKALCGAMNAECTFVAQDWDGIIPGLLANKYDAIIASMSITPERDEVVDFTNKYYNTPPAIAVQKDSDITDATPQALAGKTVGAQSSTTHANYAEAKFKDADIRLYPTAEEYKLDLASGRVDAVIDDVVVLSKWVDEEGDCCKVIGVLTPDPEINGAGAGIAIREGEPELKQKFNDAIAAIREDGTYDRIRKQYFNFDVYGD